jgi:hypothetical protein
MTARPKYVQVVKFRLLRMPCCGQLLCWVNPRLPNFCPECGKGVYSQLKENPDCTMALDEQAELKSSYQSQ